MKNRQDLLSELREGLEAGVVSVDDVRSLLHEPATPATPEPIIITEYVEKTGNTVKSDKPDKLSAVDVMFYVAGMVLFAAIMSMIVQTWNDSNVFVQLLMSSGLGVLFWVVAYSLIRSQTQSDIRKGLINSLLLTGSLSLIAGGYIATYHVVSGFDGTSTGFVPMAVALAVLSLLHLGFNRLVKRDIILLLGVLLGVAAFPTLVFGFLQSSEAPMDVWSLIIIVAAGLLAYATRVAAKANPEQAKVRTSFDGFAAFVGLGAMYASGFGDYGVLWTVVLIAAVFGIFYLSIIMQNKHLLGSGSFFLVLSVITVSFKYFSGYGITTSLIVATFGLLGTAAVAATINRKYFKQPPEQSSAAESVPFPLPIHPEEPETQASVQKSDEPLPPKLQAVIDEVSAKKPAETAGAEQPESSESKDKPETQ